MSEALRVFAPARTANEDLAMTDVPGRPPKKLQVMLERPWATSSLLES